ncbi:MAG: flagellar basal body rod protein FlgC, partial [Rhodospirillales bacterium]|nr:flagellar basal body rod protein FlgC [Rhodospirillales bacterium]
MDLIKTIKISAAGMQAQGTRLRVIAENIANADSLPVKQGDDPYRRKTVSFKNELDRSLNLRKVKIDKIVPAKGEFTKKYDPTQPAADKEAYVLVP